MIISALIWLFVVAMIAGIVLWLVSIAPFIPPPIKQFLQFAIYAILAIFVIVWLLGLIGVVADPFPHMGHVGFR